MEQTITLGDKTFQKYISALQIQKAVKYIAARINKDYEGRTPLIIPVLNGSFIFAADLARELHCACEISFIKVASYEGTNSGTLKSLIGMKEDIRGRDIIILEDIIDSGRTLAQLLPSIAQQEPNTISIATLLFKPEAFKESFTIDYTGIEISNEFIVGYGLDYNGLGRNLAEIYQLI